MSARPRRPHVPPLVRLLAATIRLILDLLNLALRTVAWLLEHLCDRLEAASAVLRYEPAPRSAPVSLAVVRPAQSKQTQPSEADKLARALWAPSRGKPDANCYALAAEMLAKAQRKAVNA